MKHLPPKLKHLLPNNKQSEWMVTAAPVRHLNPQWFLVGVAAVTLKSPEAPEATIPHKENTKWLILKHW